MEMEQESATAQRDGDAYGQQSGPSYGGYQQGYQQNGYSNGDFGDFGFGYDPCGFGAAAIGRGSGAALCGHPQYGGHYPAGNNAAGAGTTA